MEKILLIGGTGLVGSSVVHELESEGKDVICVNRSGKHPFKGDAIASDRNSYSELKRIFKKLGSFILIDMIPYTARQAAILIEALDGKQPQITAVSSIDVYQAYNNLHPQGKPVTELQNVPLKESDLLRERLSFQGIEYDKLNIERLYWSYFDACVILRMPAIYGLPDESRVDYYSTPLIQGSEVILTSEFANWKFSRSLNLNCAHAVALSANYLHKEVFNVAEEKHYSEIEWCQLIANILEIEPKIRIDETAPVPYNMNAQQDWTVDSTKIREILGYTEKYDIKAGLKRVLNALHR